MSRKKLTIVALVAGAIIALGCGLGDDAVDSGDVNRGDGKSSTGKAADKEPEQKIATMGADSVTLDHDIVVTTTVPTIYKPSTYVAEAGHKYVTFKVTLTNKGTEPFDTNLLIMDATLGEDGEQAEQVFDSAKNVGSFSTIVNPGKKVTVQVAFSAKTTDVSTIDFTLRGLNINTALFTGTVKK